MAVETKFFAVATNPLTLQEKKLPAVILLKEERHPASIVPTTVFSDKSPNPFLLVIARLPAEPKWDDRLVIQMEKEEHHFELKVIYPQAGHLLELKEEKLSFWLKRFEGPAEEMLLALADLAGIRGLRQENLTEFCRLSPPELRHLAMKLEREGLIHILEFSPLFLISQRSFSYLVEKIYAYVKKYHEKRPAETGVSFKKIKDRFSLPRQILLLALNWLAKNGQVVLEGENVSLVGFETRLSPEEAEVMKTVEQLLHQEKFSSSSFDELVKRFKIHPSRLNTMLDLLLRQKKIVKSQEGFLLHSEWLESLKRQLTELKRKGQTELTVGDFKRLTGLTRKYAIPLLEFLDEQGLTRRVGNKRIIV